MNHTMAIQLAVISQMANKYGERQVQKWHGSYETRPPPIVPENLYYSDIANNPNLSIVPSVRIPLAESMKDTYYRVIESWREIQKQILAGQCILIVAHGTIARCPLKQIEHVSDEEINSLYTQQRSKCLRVRLSKWKFIGHYTIYNTI